MSGEVRQSTASHVTYADLERSHAESLAVGGKGQQQIRNHLSSLASFMTCFGRNASDPIGDDFGVYFRDRIDEFITWGKEKGLKNSTMYTRASDIRCLWRTAEGLILGIDTSFSFSELLALYIKRSGKTQLEVAEAIKLDKRLLYAWVSGKQPGAHNRKYVPGLEKHLEAPPGALQAKLRQMITPYANNNGTLKAKNEYRERQKRLSREPYCYKQPSDKIRQEWLELLKFQTAPYLLNGFKRNIAWRVKPAQRVPMLEKWYFAVPGGLCPTASIRWRYFSAFFGYLILPVDKGGFGLDEENLSIALLTDAELILSYIEFRRARSGVFTTEIPKFLDFCTTLMRGETGYLRQNSKLCRLLREQITPSEWDGWCEVNRERLIEVNKSLKKGGHVKMARDPQDAIAYILSRQHPVKALFEMIQAMESFRVVNASDIQSSLHKRNTLLIKMLTANPLRVHHYSIMTYREDNTGNLYQRPGKSWCLRYAPEDFKNQRGAASKPYDIVLSDWLWRDIDEYLHTYWPNLKKGIATDFVFIPGPQGARSGDLSKGWPPDKISGRVLILTKIFLPNCIGFSAHAFRHIIATDYIKNNPNGYQVVASILHDRLDTVMREYAHLKVADGFSFWTSYLDESISRFKGGER